MDWDVIFNATALHQFAAGIGMTLELTLLSLLIGGVCAVPLAVMRVSRQRWIAGPIWFYTYVMRGTPMLVQVYMIYYGIAQLDIVQQNWDTVPLLMPFKDALFCALLAFALNTCAYTVEMLAGAIRDTYFGEIEAAKAMGMGKWLMMRRIVLPSAMRRTLPAYSNEVIMMLQGSALASTVPGLTDITAVANDIRAQYFLVFEPYITAAVLYLLLTFIIIGLFKLAERRWLAHLRVRKI